MRRRRLLALLFGVAALALASVPGQHPELFQFSAQLRVELEQCASNTQLRRTGLAQRTTASRSDQNVELVCGFGREQRLLHHRPSSGARKIVVKCAPVHGDGSVTVPEEHTRDGRLAAASSQMLHQCCHDFP